MAHAAGSEMWPPTEHAAGVHQGDQIPQSDAEPRVFSFHSAGKGGLCRCGVAFHVHGVFGEFSNHADGHGHESVCAQVLNQIHCIWAELPGASMTAKPQGDQPEQQGDGGISNQGLGLPAGAVTPKNPAHQIRQTMGPQSTDGPRQMGRPRPGPKGSRLGGSGSDPSLDGAVNNGAFGAVDAVLMDVEIGVDDVACSHQKTITRVASNI